MLNTIVTETKIYKSCQNVRFALVDSRQAFNLDDATQTSKTLKQNEIFAVNNFKYLHFHSDNSIILSLVGDNDNTMTLTTKMLTLYNEASINAATITNTNENPANIYVVYA